MIRRAPKYGMRAQSSVPAVPPPPTPTPPPQIRIPEAMSTRKAELQRAAMEASGEYARARDAAEAAIQMQQLGFDRAELIRSTQLIKESSWSRWMRAQERWEQCA